MRISRETCEIYLVSRFSTIFTSADKSFLTYPYLTHGIDKKDNSRCCQYFGCIGHVTLSLRPGSVWYAKKERS